MLPCNIYTLPTELVELYLELSGNPTVLNRVCKAWKEYAPNAYFTLLASYRTNPKVSPYIPAIPQNAEIQQTIELVKGTFRTILACHKGLPNLAQLIGNDPLDLTLLLKRIEDANLVLFFEAIKMQLGEVQIPPLDANGIRGWIEDHSNLVRGIKTLVISKQSLTSIPPEIGKFENLESLYADGNGLTTLPPELAQLRSLNLLNLSRNRFSSFPSVIFGLSQLCYLQMNGNQLRSIPPEISQLERLQHLFLSDNSIEAVPPQIGHVTSLIHLNLSDNQLVQLPEEFGNLHSLNALKLDRNRLTTLPVSIGLLFSLTYLYLDQNELSQLPENFGGLSALKCLHLSSNHISTLPPTFSGLTRLERLRINGNPLQEIPQHTLNQFPNLKLLEIEGNQGFDRYGQS